MTAGATLGHAPDPGGVAVDFGEGVVGNHQGPVAAAGFHVHRDRHVLAQEVRHRRHGQADVHRTALGIDAGRDEADRRREGARGEGIGHAHRRLAQGQDFKVLFVHRHQHLGVAGAGDFEQHAAGLHQVAGFDVAGEHGAGDFGADRGFFQQGPGGGLPGQRGGFGGAAFGQVLHLQPGEQVAAAGGFPAGLLQPGLGLAHGGLGARARGAAQLVQGGIGFGGLGLKVVGAQHGQHVAGLHGVAFLHAPLQHHAGNRAADLGARDGHHAGRGGSAAKIRNRP